MQFIVKSMNITVIYWSKFLFIIWLTISSIISLLMYLFIFSEQIIIFRLSCLCFAISYSLNPYIYYNISSDVYNEANNSYILFNSLMKTIPQKSYSRFKVSFHSFMKIYLIIIICF